MLYGKSFGGLASVQFPEIAPGKDDMLLVGCSGGCLLLYTCALASTFVKGVFKAKALQPTRGRLACVWHAILSRGSTSEPYLGGSLSTML